MKLYSLQSEMVVSRPRDEVFAFFEQPENLAAITPPSMGFEILTPGPISMRAGAVFDYAVKIMGFTRHWRSYIVEYLPPESFVDIQLEGPYTIWHHTHRFLEKDGHTVIIDEVRYAVPFGFIGSILNLLFIRRQLKYIFDYRISAINRLLTARAGLMD